MAGLNQDQLDAIQAIKNSSGLAQPLLDQAATLAKQGSTPLTFQDYTEDNINKYLSPYLDDVVNSTMALQDIQNREQQTGLAGNITAAGAWGGDRSGVVQAELARNQKLADNATIAQLKDQGFTNAQNQFNTANQTSLQAQQANNANALNSSFALGNLGTAEQNAALSGASALLNAGTLQQQQAQNDLSAKYGTWLQQQAYPYQQLDFLASVLPGVQQGTGTTTTTTKPAANPFSQILGLAATAAPFFIKDGGRVGLHNGGRPRLASGGVDAPSDIYALSGRSLTPSLQNMMEVGQMGSGLGYAPIPNAPEIPSSFIQMASPTGGNGIGPVPDISGGGDSGDGGMGKSLGTLAGTIYDAVNTPSPTSLNNWAHNSIESNLQGMVNGGGNGFASDLLGGMQSTNLNPSSGGLFGWLGLQDGGRARLADGGADDFDTLLDDLYPGPDGRGLGATALSPVQTPPEWRGKVTNFAEPVTDVPSGSGSLSSPAAQVGQVIRDADSGTDGDYLPPGWGLQHAPQVVPQIYKPKPDWRRAVAMAGAAMMAGRSPNFGENVGQGLAAGVQNYYDQVDKDNNPVVDHSGPSTLIRYADGTVVDTGLPTEAAMNARATSDWRREQTAQRTEAARVAAQDRADRLAFDREKAIEAQKDRDLQRDIARMNAGETRRYHDFQMGLDADGQPTSAAAEAVQADPNSASILAQTGLSLPAFMALTGQVTKLPRDKASRAQALKEAQDFANKNGVDTSTFATQYGAYNDTLKSNILRNNQTKIMEEELQGTLDNLKPVADAAGNGNLRWANVAKLFMGQEVNDPVVNQYAFNLNQLRSELAAYNGATQGRTGNNLTVQDYNEAERVIKNGLSSKGAEGFRKAIHAATDKMGEVLQRNIRNSNKAVWDLFGVGGQYDKTHPAPGAAAPAGGAPPAQTSPTVTTRDQFDALPSGTVYIGKDGKKYRKP